MVAIRLVFSNPHFSTLSVIAMRLVARDSQLIWRSVVKGAGHAHTRRMTKLALWVLHDLWPAELALPPVARAGMIIFFVGLFIAVWTCGGFHAVRLALFVLWWTVEIGFFYFLVDWFNHAEPAASPMPRVWLKRAFVLSAFAPFLTYRLL